MQCKNVADLNVCNIKILHKSYIKPIWFSLTWSPASWSYSLLESNNAAPLRDWLRSGLGIHQSKLKTDTDSWMIHCVGGSFCCFELHSRQDGETVTDQLTNGAEAGLIERSQWCRQSCAVQLRHEELQGVAVEESDWKCTRALRRKAGWRVNVEEGKSVNEEDRWSTKKRRDICRLTSSKNWARHTGESACFSEHHPLNNVRDINRS